MAAGGAGGANDGMEAGGGASGAGWASGSPVGGW
jgi:hypothetical protein